MSPRRTALRALRFVAVAALAGPACGRDHSALEQEPTGAGGGGGATAVSVSAGLVTVGTGSSAGGAGAGGFDGSGPTTTGAGGQGQGGARPEEPDGPTRIVLVHGVADRDRVGFCFATPAGEGVQGPIVPAGGMGFAGVAEATPAAFSGVGDAVVVMIAGLESDLAAATCEEVLARPADFPELEVAPLGLVPGDALAAPRILVLAATGCLGGEDHTSDVAEVACGAGYAPTSPTASLVAASPSRLAPPDRLGFQSIGASLAAAPFDVWLRPSVDGVPFAVSEDLSWGAVAPFPPSHDLDAASVGVPAQLAAVVTLPNDEETVLADVDLADAAERAGIDTFRDGEAISIVFVGASPGLGDGPWWHGFAAAMIPKDP